MPNRLISISNILLLILILFCAYFQILSPQKFSTVNDLCQDYLSVSWLRLNQPAYQLFSHTQCQIKSKSLPTQYNAHPPTSLIFFYPLSFTSLQKATSYWDIFSVITYFISLIILLIISKTYSFRLLAIVFCLSTIWITINLNYAVRNLSLLILLLTSLSVAGLIHKKYFAVGFLIGIATLIKLWPVIFIIPILVYPRYYKVLVSLSLTIISIVVITIGLFGFTVFSDYFFKVIPYEKIFSNYPNNNSFTSSITKVFRGVDPHRYPPL